MKVPVMNTDSSSIQINRYCKKRIQFTVYFKHEIKWYDVPQCKPENFYMTDGCIDMDAAFKEYIDFWKRKLLSTIPNPEDIVSVRVYFW